MSSLGSCKLGGEGRLPELASSRPRLLDQPVLGSREDGTYHKGVITNEDGTHDAFADEDLQQNTEISTRPWTK